eukprot:CAMPEP_0170581064 /NCGR_PEP_ID=MMETSP0224-20130122/6839_1 /TAXON_ID=285029 /ORGANISM="Togula jolla, Strain CCCM 725" /LENGTH=56 /DNA_ID=CAMNT_0010904173 /DNA_START=97 /DNA_END=263 /DNA_ORIENTATION=-
MRFLNSTKLLHRLPPKPFEALRTFKGVELGWSFHYEQLGKRIEAVVVVVAGSASMR